MLCIQLIIRHLSSFFEEVLDLDDRKLLYRKAWNAQIPIAIVCGAGTITVYNGCLIDKHKARLEELECYTIDAINEDSPFSFWEIANQDMWATRIEQFGGEKLNDRLLQNLSDITEKLKNRYGICFATKLVLRLIFIRFLIDRGVDLDYNEIGRAHV